MVPKTLIFVFQFPCLILSEQVELVGKVVSLKIGLIKLVTYSHDSQMLPIGWAIIFPERGP